MQAEAILSVGGRSKEQGAITVPYREAKPAGGSSRVIVRCDFLESLVALFIYRDVVDPQDRVGARPDPTGEAFNPEELSLFRFETVVVQVTLRIESAMNLARDLKVLLLTFFAPGNGIDRKTNSDRIGFLPFASRRQFMPETREA